MISCHLQGRTGNQLFQISAAYAHAKENSFEFIAPPTSLNEQLWPSHRFTGLNYGPMSGNVYNEPHFHYSPIPAEDNTILNGYFQSSKYFESCWIELVNIFGLVGDIELGTVAVHVRRGDYIQYNQQFNLLPLKWYQEAIEEMGKDYEYHFYSDDINWCKTKFKGIFHSGLPMQDLIDGAKKEHTIMSASSFSWWMAYAGMHPNQKVIAPKTWFGPKNQHHDTKDIYEKHWKLC